jgi:hypothetical protein
MARFPSIENRVFLQPQRADEVRLSAQREGVISSSSLDCIF